MPADYDGGGGGYNPRVADPRSFTSFEVAALEVALETSRLANERSNGLTSSALPGLNLRG